jgi:Sortase and related acyltransferases
MKAEMVRRLTAEDGVEYFALRQEALTREPCAFGSSPDDDRFRSVEAVREMLRDPSHLVIGVFTTELAGAVGVRREMRSKLRHKAVLWGMYVRADYRRQGFGRRLVEEAIRVAREDGVVQLHLTATERAAAARALYESLGFVVWGVEPSGLRVQGQDLAEHHMVLRL